MAASVPNVPTTNPSPEKLVAERAEEVATVLKSFAASLKTLNAANPTSAKPAQEKWWRTQAGRFEDDPTFADFVADVQAARKREG